MKRTNTASNRKAIGSSEPYSIVILGAGNVATHMARHLHFAGHSIPCIWSRNHQHACKLAAEVDGKGTSDPGEVPKDADLYLLAVSDRAIQEVSGKFHGWKGTWAHTSGAVSMEVLEKDFRQFGVLYPLQTLSAERTVSMADVPFLVEGSGHSETGLICRVASSISNSVVETDSAQRLVIHLAAVFANNFSNHMVGIAEKIMHEHGKDFTLLAPILRETFRKVEGKGAAAVQTGPAIRNDQVTMEKHLELLKEYPEWEKLYIFVSRDIGRSRQLTKDLDTDNDQL